MGSFLNVIKEDPKVRVKIKVVLDKYYRIPPNYYSKIGHDTLIQNVIPKTLINIMGPTIVHIDIELKLKISRIKILEKKLL